MAADTTERHGGMVVAEELARHGVRVLFTLCGGHISPILVAARQRGLRVVDVRDEATAVFAADAVSRLTGTPGVAAVTAGPGVTNAITALKNAQLAHSPLVLLGGATATILKGRGALQDIDQMALVRPHVKLAVAVRRVRDLAAAIARAFGEAQRGVPGPTFVECPVDLLYPESLVRGWYLAGSREAQSVGERATRWYLERHLGKVFAPQQNGAGRRRPFVRTPAPEIERRAARLAERLARAARPVLVVGSQAVGGGADVSAVAAAIDRLGVPAYLSGMARGLLGPSHPRQFRHQRKQALREADLVVLAGTPCDFRLDYGRHINRRAFLAAINWHGRDMSRNRRPHLGVVAPPGPFLEALAQHVPHAVACSPWLETLGARERARDEEIARQAATPATPLNPLQVCAAIERHLGDDSVIVADGGDFVATASYIVRPRRPLSWLDPGVFGTLGVGAGFVLGAQASRPQSEIWAIFGDGALGFSLAEFDTFVRHGVPVIAVVGTDAKWAQIARDQVAVLHDDVGTVLRRTAYHEVVAGFGARGLLLDSPSCIDATFAAAREAARAGVPVLINAIIGDTDFRKGSLSL